MIYIYIYSFSLYQYGAGLSYLNQCDEHVSQKQSKRNLTKVYSLKCGWIMLLTSIFVMSFGISDELQLASNLSSTDCWTIVVQMMEMQPSSES